MRYWINTVSREHVVRGIEGGFTQAQHGKSDALKRIARGDLIAFYSPRTAYPAGEPLQKFTALGRVLDDAPYQVQMTPDFHPWRRNVDFLPAKESDVRPLVDRLSFIRDKHRWGFPFRRGLFEVPEADFEVIRAVMQA
jgi:hypothetical protein